MERHPHRSPEVTGCPNRVGPSFVRAAEAPSSCHSPVFPVMPGGSRSSPRPKFSGLPINTEGGTSGHSANVCSEVREKHTETLGAIIVLDNLFYLYNYLCFANEKISLL